MSKIFSTSNRNFWIKSENCELFIGIDTNQTIIII